MNYKQSTETLTVWTRCKHIDIINPINAAPKLRFYEQQAFEINGQIQTVETGYKENTVTYTQKIIVGVTCILVGMAISIYTNAAELNFKYTLPTTRVDGAKLTNSQIKTCTFYRNNVSAGDMGKSGTFKYTETSNLTVTYSATCTDSNGVESAKSTTITISLSPPIAPILEIAP